MPDAGGKVAPDVIARTEALLRRWTDCLARYAGPAPPRGFAPEMREAIALFTEGTAGDPLAVRGLDPGAADVIYEHARALLRLASDRIAALLPPDGTER